MLLSNFYSPKNLLANYLSQTLAAFFNVNPEEVQSNLVQDAKVVLNHVEIKERCFFEGGSDEGTTHRHHLKAYGSIDQIELAWVWSGVGVGEDTSSFIKDVKLIVRGVHVHVDIVANENNRNGDDAIIDDEAASARRRSSTNNNSNNSEDNSQKGDWKADYLQQILDNLTLIVTDVTISIHTRSSDDQQQIRKDDVVVLQMKDVELKTIQSGSGNSKSNNDENYGGYIDNDAALMQTISIASVEVRLEKEQDESGGDAGENTKNNNTQFHEVTGLTTASMDNLSGLFREGSALVIEAIEMRGFINNPTLGSEKVNANNISVPFPIRLNVSTFRCKTNEFDVRFEKLGIDYVLLPQRSIYIHCDRVIENKIISVKGLYLNLTLNSEKQYATIPGLDLIEKASLNVAEIQKLVMDGKGMLLYPLKNTLITYQEGVLATDIDNMQLECWAYQENQELFMETLSLRVQHDSIDTKIGKMTTRGGMVSFNALRTSVIARLRPLRSDELPLGMFSFIALDLAAIDSLRIHTSSLKSSGITNLTVRFENDVLSCHIPYLYVQRENGNGKGVSPTSFASKIPSPPCKTKLTVESFHLVDSKEENQALKSLQETRCRSLTLVLDPVMSGAEQQSQPIEMRGIAFQAICDDFESIDSIKTAVNIPSISISGLLQSNDLGKICNLAVGIEKAQLAAAFSSSDWAESLEGEEVIVRLPFTSIPKFKLTLRLIGPLIKLDDATIACDEFIGCQDTTLECIKNHYIGIVQKRIPYLIANIDLVGANVADSVAVLAATLLTRTNVIGATFGVASRDLIGSTITTGKVLRGAEASDKYQFGELDSLHQCIRVSIMNCTVSFRRLSSIPIYLQATLLGV